jgi:hypothetical protein
MRLVMSRLKGGATVAEVRSVIGEVRGANRLVYAEVLGADGRIVIDEFRGQLRARPMLSDAELFKRGKALGTGDVLQAVLNRADLSAELKDTIRQELSIAMLTGQIEPQGLARAIGAMKKASKAVNVEEVLAELVHGNVTASTLKADAKVVLNAKAGVEYTFGGKTVKIDPLSEADALYLGNDAKVHADEVKNTAHGLREKLERTPQQLENYLIWKAQDPTGREISVVVHTDAEWTELFPPIAKGRPEATMEELIKKRVTLRIAGREWSPQKMQEIWDTVLKVGSKDGKNPSGAFFKSISNFDDAQKVLGISL